MRRAEDPFVVWLIHFMRDDGRALRDEGPKPARMVEVVVRVHDILDGFVGDQPLRFGDDRVCARIVLGSFDDDDVVLEVDRKGGIRRENEVDTIRQFL